MKFVNGFHSSAFPVVLGSKNAKELHTETKLKWNMAVCCHIQENERGGMILLQFIK